nr:hypothetical protein [Tanacetum cinerariifolium]
MVDEELEQLLERAENVDMDALEEESVGDEFTLRRQEKGKDKEKLQELTVIDPMSSPSSSLPKPKTELKKFHQLAKHLHSTMEGFLPLMVGERVNEIAKKIVPLYGTYSIGESSSEQVMDQEPNLSGSGTQEQIDEFDAWMDGFGINNDEVPKEEVLQDL